MPVDSSHVLAMVARSAMVLGSNTVTSATAPARSRPRRAMAGLRDSSSWAGRMVILASASASPRTPRSRT